jgi:hypothetical protein
MPVETTWTIEFGYSSDGSTVTWTDLTSRVLGFSNDTRVILGQIGQNSVTITLDNNDGALTPGAGGTYSSWDWFERAVHITALVDLAPNPTAGGDLFTGLVDDFDLADDGRHSTVTITAVDIVQILGRATTTATYSAVTNLDTDDTIDSVIADGFTVPTVGLNPAPALDVELQGSATVLHQWGDGGVTGSPGDIISNNILPAGLFTFIGKPNRSTVAFEWRSVVQYLAKGATTVTFDNDDASALPFREIRRGFNTDEMTNAYEQTRIDGSGTSSASNTASQSKYGVRQRSYTTSATSSVYGDPVAEDWANRFADSTFDVRELVTSAAIVKDRDGWYLDWGDVLGANLLLTPTDVTFTPTGGSSTTEQCVIVGRRVDVTPNDSVVTLTLRPASTYRSFILDSDAYGVLDQNRLGAFS